jgi:Cu(I)/Ag(I) efflux system membrane protein CusA/SilA
LTSVIFIVGLTPIGVRMVFFLTLFVALVSTWLAARQSLKLPWRIGAVASLVLVALVADQNMTRLGREFMPPLDEGSILDMPITVPRASITQAADDLKARDRLLRMFPEVELVVGKAGRAETPTDPAPPDMIETVVNLRPKAQWPKRKLRYADALAQTRAVVSTAEERDWVAAPQDDQERADLLNQITMEALTRFDAGMRSFALERYVGFEHGLAPEMTQFAVDETLRLLQGNQKLLRPVSSDERLQFAEELAPAFGSRLVETPDLVLVTGLASDVSNRLVEIGVAEAQANLLVFDPSPTGRLVGALAEVMGAEPRTFFTRLLAAIEDERGRRFREFTTTLNWELFDHAVGAYCWHVLEALVEAAREPGYLQKQPTQQELQAARTELGRPFSRWVFLWRTSKEDLLKELDTAIEMPGWGNIWTQPIINRVEMLATGVRTMIGVKVYGNDLDQIQGVSEEVAQVLRTVPGAVDVLPDQIVGEGYLEIDIDRERAARYGVSVGDIQDVIETALGGKVITTTVEGRERFPVRIRYARAFREDEEQVKDLLVSAGGMAGASTMLGAPDASASGLERAMNRAGYPGSEPDMPNSSSSPTQVPLSMVADVRIVEGPSMIKSENGLLRAYVQLNVRDRDIVGFVEEAQRTVAEKVKLPQGMYLEWSGQFEYQMRARKTLQVIFPIVILVIFVILYVTYNDLADATLMMVAVPGAVAGGVLFQWLWGFNFSVAVWVGFIACFGLATETGIVMLVYLREAVEKAGGLANISLPQLRQAVIDGAVHRLRPKLLTEATTIVGLAPMLWATGTGAEIMRPMAAPVLGGILVADEVIDLLLPVLFHWVRRRRWQRLHRCETPGKQTPVSEGSPDFRDKAVLGESSVT